MYKYEYMEQNACHRYIINEHLHVYIYTNIDIQN